MTRGAGGNQGGEAGLAARVMAAEHPAPPHAPMTLRICGALGVAPFWLLPLIGFVSASDRAMAGQALAGYAAIILSFLGGSRLGLTLSGERATSTILLSMAPPLLGWALMLVPTMSQGLRFCGLALCLTGHALWDGHAQDVPQWYGSLRRRLTVCAVGGLLAAAAVWHG